MIPPSSILHHTHALKGDIVLQVEGKEGYVDRGPLMALACMNTLAPMFM